MTGLLRLMHPAGLLRFLEDAVLLRNFVTTSPQLFIVGLPRSGTTLIYQYIVHRLDVAYFTHGVGRHPRSALMTTWCHHRRHGKYISDFRSTFGKVDGAASPREAGSFWNRFFDIDAYSSCHDVDPASVRSLQRTVAGVQQVYGGAPFVNKNVKHMLRFDALCQIFPAASFLVVDRELHDVAISLTRARVANQGDAGKWWSVRPPNYEALCRLPPAEQIAGQVVSLQDRLTTDLARLPEERVMRIQYDSFCNAPDDLTSKIRSQLDNPAYRNEPVDSFPISKNQPRDDLERDVLRCLDELLSS